MNYADKVKAALEQRDAVAKELEGFDGQELTDETRAKVEELEARSSDLAKEIVRLDAKAQEERAVEEARAKSPLYTPRVRTEDRAVEGEEGELRSLVVNGGRATFE